MDVVFIAQQPESGSIPAQNLTLNQHVLHAHHHTTLPDGPGALSGALGALQHGGLVVHSNVWIPQTAQLDRLVHAAHVMQRSVALTAGALKHASADVDTAACSTSSATGVGMLSPHQRDTNASKTHILPICYLTATDAALLRAELATEGPSQGPSDSTTSSAHQLVQGLQILCQKGLLSGVEVGAAAYLESTEGCSFAEALASRLLLASDRCHVDVTTQTRTFDPSLPFSPSNLPTLPLTPPQIQTVGENLPQVFEEARKRGQTDILEGQQGVDLPQRFKNPSIWKKPGRKQHVLYTTTSAAYGGHKPALQEMPPAWNGLKAEISSTWAGNYNYSGLRTAVTASRIHTALDLDLY